ncbi:hypothetical protein Z043_125374 [Scleropages formosus]|uniref:C2H2-type domain-containing protein n=1 Tax=Scleropages formosus TaxID=113540 RepID=A0A0P7W385_SCLFO|nr:hypothetical protein Z043_125374 [Scleropages formosus]
MSESEVSARSNGETLLRISSGVDFELDPDSRWRPGGCARTVEGPVAHVKRLPVGDPYVVCAGLSEQQMGHSMWGGARSETLFKLEPGGQSVKETLGHTRSGGKVEKLSLNIGSAAHERSAQLVRVADVLVDDQPCTEVADLHTCFQPELEGAGVVLPSSAASGAESDVTMEYVMRSTWSEDLGPGVAQTQHGCYAEDGQRTDIPSKSGASMCSPHAPAVSASQSYGLDANGFLTHYKRFAAPESTKTYRKFETRGKVFVCKFCGKCCTRSSNLKRHQRVHTGEKPFSCTLCGKKFTQSCSLKRHQSVHTGARPFHCPRCRKQFSYTGDLQKHQCSHWRKTV